MSIALVTGGGRSGKSTHALRLAEECPAPRVFIATATPVDTEMRERIRRHREERSGKGWRTIEEPVDLEGALRKARGSGVVVVDCLSIWVNNLLMEEEKGGGRLDDDRIAGLAFGLAAECRSSADCAFIFVTNEVGMGIIPDNPLARRFRDLLGRLNQAMAGAADEVMFLCCGIPLKMKQGGLK